MKNGHRSRRDFLKAILGIGSVATLAALASSLRYLSFVPPPMKGKTTQQLSWPRAKLLNVSSLPPLKPVRFNYPLVNTPNILVKLGTRVENGVGPDGDIVAYSDICQHLGCYYSFLTRGDSPPCNSSFKAKQAQGYCCCHGGEFDFLHGGKVIGGPPPRPVPPVVLEYDNATGDLYAVGMGPPTIYGHGPPGTTDPALVLKYDLQGGEVVTQDTVFKV